MRLYVLPLLWLSCLLLCTRPVWAQTTTTRISLALEQAPLKTVFRQIEEKAHVIINYSEEVVDGTQRVTIKLEQVTVSQALQAVLRNTSYEYVFSGGAYIIRKKAPVTPKGKITGKVLDEENGQPVAQATVLVNNNGATTDMEGGFSLALPHGTYEAEVSFVGYEKKLIRDIVIKENESFELTITLKRQKGSLQGVVVTSSVRKESVAALYLRQKNNASISDGISTAQIKVTADNNAAQVLKRVSGVVIQQDKFVTIRGMSDRYNNVLINRSMLPSTEPNRRNFSFDIVPSSMIDNIVINKTATPDMPGEFTGGLVQINTKDVPDRNFFDVTVGTGFNAFSMGKQMQDRQRYSGDYFAAKGSQRDWYLSTLQPHDYVAALFKNDKAYMAEVGSRIPANWTVYNYAYAPVQNYQLAGGMLHKFGNNQSIGFTAGATYRNEQSIETGEKRNLSNSSYNTDRYKFITSLGALFNMAWKSNHHRVSFKNLYNRRFNNQFDNDLGFDFNQQKTVNITTSNPLINTVIQNRLEGEHTIGHNVVKLEWFADRNTLDRDQPDTRYVMGMQAENGTYTYNFKEAFISWGALFASRLKEKRRNAGGSITVPFTIARNTQQLKVGYSYSDRESVYSGTGFRVIDDADQEWINRKKGLAYEQIVTQENLLKQYIAYRPTYFSTSTTGDGYNGNQVIKSAYFMGDLRLLQSVRLSGGVRYEENNMQVKTQYIEDDGSDSLRWPVMPVEKVWLPSVNLIYSITSRLNLRLAYGETLARPDFAERSPYIYFDFPEQLYVYGLEGLKTTRVKNYDMRVEYYPSGNEIASVSFFYKDFTNPVERFFMLGNPTNGLVYQNLDKAIGKGFEVDLRKSLGFIKPGSFLKNLYISGNYSYLKGHIETYDTRLDSATNRYVKMKVGADRPIQGLAPYVINLGLNYQSKLLGFNIAYSRFGRRIVYGGTYEQYLQYEVPRDVVDLQLSLLLAKQRLEIRLNAADIIPKPYILYSNSTNSTSGGAGIFNDGPNGAGYDKDHDFINYKLNRSANYSFVVTYKF
ncbi:MAG: TonB-dependent receptor [Chitinophagaceae bacterium]